MSTTTTNLGLFKYDIVQDASQVFSITNALNNNWDVIDAEMIKKEDVAKSVTNLGVISGTLTLEDNCIYRLTPSDNITFSLPTITNINQFHQILIQLNLSTVYSIDVGTTYFFNETAPDLSSIGVYDLIFEYDNVNQYWVCGLLTKGAAS